MQAFYFFNFFKQRLCIFSQKLSNENKQRLYKIQKCPTSLFYHVLLIKQNECTFYLELICTFWSKIVDGIKKTFEDVKEKLDSQALMHFRCRLVPIDKIENRDQTFGFDHDPEK